MRAFVERLYPGRWDGLRPVNKQEFKATTILGMELTEASAKIRTGNPVDDDEDYALPIWAGVIGLEDHRHGNQRRRPPRARDREAERSCRVHEGRRFR